MTGDCQLATAACSSESLLLVCFHMPLPLHRHAANAAGGWQCGMLGGYEETRNFFLSRQQQLIEATKHLPDGSRLTAGGFARGVAVQIEERKEVKSEERSRSRLLLLVMLWRHL